MLTLKVITTDLNGQSETHVFGGDSFVHREYFSEDRSIATKIKQKNLDIWIIGSMVETSSTQKFTVSEVEVYDEDRCLKHSLFIVPKADCYIMDNGKTVDSFFCWFEN